MSGKYRNNFLKNVTVRVDFTKNLYPISSELPPSLKERVLERFSHMQRKGAIAEQIEMKCGSDPVRRHVKENHWFFQGKMGDRALCIAPNFMWLDFKKFTDYGDLRETFLAMVDAFFEAFPEVPDLGVNRFGLRYFNNIELTESNLTDWSAYLDPSLHSIFPFVDDSSAVIRAFNNLELKYGDMNLTFLYGMYNFDYPAAMKQKTFTLDFDSFIAKVLTRDQLPASLDFMHDRIAWFFEKSITDRLRELMS